METDRQWEGPLRQQEQDKRREGESAPWALLRGSPGSIGMVGRLEEATLRQWSDKEVGQIMKRTAGFGDAR